MVKVGKVTPLLALLLIPTVTAIPTAAGTDFSTATSASGVNTMTGTAVSGVASSTPTATPTGTSFGSNYNTVTSFGSDYTTATSSEVKNSYTPTTTKTSTTKTSTTAKPTETNEGGQSGSGSGDTKKKLEIEVGDGGKKIEIHSKSENSTVKYEAQYGLNTNGVPRARAAFKLESNDTTSAFDFRVSLFKLAEVNAGQNMSVANSTNDIKFPGNGQFWSPITISDVPNTGNVTLKKFTTTYSRNLNATNGKNTSVIFDAFLAGQPVTVDGVNYSPRGLKYGLTIENFPFMYNDSQLAIVKGLIVKTKDENEYAPANRSLAIAGGKGRFNWTSYVLMDGQWDTITAENGVYTQNDVQVNLGKSKTTDPEDGVKDDETVKVLVFKTKPGNFSRIAWDPEVILNEEQIVAANIPVLNSTTGTKKSSAAVTTASLALSLLVIAASVFVNYF